MTEEEQHANKRNREESDDDFSRKWLRTEEVLDELEKMDPQGNEIAEEDGWTLHRFRQRYPSEEITTLRIVLGIRCALMVYMEEEDVDSNNEALYQNEINDAKTRLVHGFQTLSSVTQSYFSTMRREVNSYQDDHLPETYICMMNQLLHQIQEQEKVLVQEPVSSTHRGKILYKYNSDLVDYRRMVNKVPSRLRIMNPDTTYTLPTCFHY